MDFAVGETHHLMLGAIKPYKIHIVAIVDEVQIVYKYYGRTKQWWHYGIDHKDILEARIEIANRWFKSFKKNPKNERSK